MKISYKEISLKHPLSVLRMIEMLNNLVCSISYSAISQQFYAVIPKELTLSLLVILGMASIFVSTLKIVLKYNNIH